jgi:hypothetical protein
MGGSHEKADAWADIAGNASWSARQIQSAEQLRWALVETLTGASSLTATQTKLHVNFNPKAVAAYRLIGHEATGYGGLLAGAVESDVHVDEETSVLFEVWLHPNDEENIGQVTLEWTEAATGQARRAGPQRISRLQFATDFEGSPISLQAAALGGETAEILRQGYNFSLVSPQIYHYQPKPRKLEDVQALSRRANAALEARPEFQRLVELVDAASRLPAPANPLAARSGTRGIVSGEWRELRE